MNWIQKGIAAIKFKCDKFNVVAILQPMQPKATARFHQTYAAQRADGGLLRELSILGANGLLAIYH